MREFLAMVFCLSVLAFLVSFQDSEVADFGAVPVKTCLDEDCHYDYLAKFRRIAEDFAARDVHAERGMTCIDCHRVSREHIEDGDPHTEMDRPAYPWEQPQRCGGCHSNALVMRRFDPAPDLTAEQLFWTSKHGQAQRRIRNLVQEGRVNLNNGIEAAADVATCTSCHGVHGIQKVDNPLAPVFSRNVAKTCGMCHGSEELFTDYSTALSVIDAGLAFREEKIRLLARAAPDYESADNIHRQKLEDEGQLEAPTCNDCHGNHSATPPGSLGGSRVAEICGICHVQSYNDYMASPKAEIFSLSEYRDCYACHNNHLILRTSDEMVGLQEGSICHRCHEDHGPQAEGIIAGIREAIEDLKAVRRSAEEIIVEAERKGMDVSRGHSKLTEVNTALVSARAKIHTFDVEKVKQAAEPGFGIAEEARRIGEEALQDLAFRHWGLAATSLIILFTAILLFLKIRQIDRRSKEQ